MDRIRHILALARRRLVAVVLADSAVVGAIAAALVAALGVIVLKLVPAAGAVAATGVGATGALAIAAAAAFAIAAAVAFLVRRSALPADATLALRVDERLKLDERFTTALALERSDDAYARAAIADAVDKASDPALPARVRAAFPVRWSGHGVWAVALLAIAFAAS